MPFSLNYLYCSLGWGTHGLLDACTSYGTQLYWPFSNFRVAWDNISIIDPLFTIPIIILILISNSKAKPLYAQIATAFSIGYLSLGLLQKHRAENAIQELADKRGHTHVEVKARPSLGNLILWKSIYLYKNSFYIDGVKIFKQAKIIEGGSIKKFNLHTDLPEIEKNSILARDIKRFSWFAMDYLALSPDKNNFIMDIRYSTLPQNTTGLWGIEFDRNDQNQGVHFKANPKRQSRDLKKLIEMIF